MDSRWYTVVLAVFVSQMLATSGAIQHHRVARDEAEGLGAILQTAKDVTNPEKITDTVQVLTGLLLGDNKVLGLGRKRRDLYSPSALVRMEDDVDALDSGEVNWRVAHVPGEKAKSGAEASGISTPSNASSERKRRAAQMEFPSMMPPAGKDPEEYKQKAQEMMQSGAEASGFPANMPPLSGTERKRRAAQMPDGMTPPSSISDGMTPPSSLPNGMTPPSSMSDGMTPPSSFPNGMTPPSSMSDRMTPPSSMSDRMTPPSSMSDGMTPPSKYGEMAKSGAEASGITPPSKIPSDRKRKRRQSMEDMAEETQTKSTKHSKHGGKGNKKGKGKGKGKGNRKLTTPGSP